MNRIVSFLPTGTEMLYALGLGSSVVGRSEHCCFPPAVKTKPVVVSSKVKKIAAQDSVKIHEAVKKLKEENAHQFSINMNLLKKLKPDTVITQNLCSVCAAGHTEVEEAISELSPRPKVVTLQAQGLRQVLGELKRLGSSTGKTAAANRLVSSLEKRLQAIGQKLRKSTATPRVWCCEWLEPLMAAGHWVPEMVVAAGGRDILGQAAKNSRWIHWEQVREHDPEVILVMPCSYTISETLREKTRLTNRPGWKNLSAVKNGRVFAVEGAYFHHAGPRLVSGVELLSHLIHPELFPASRYTKQFKPLR